MAGGVVTIRGTRYEEIMRTSRFAGELSRSMATASQYARRTIAVDTERERSIRDVAAGVAGPALLGYLIWLAREVPQVGGNRVYFLSRDGQILHRLAVQFASTLGWKAKLKYVYSSRRTWNLAASTADDLAHEAWLFGSFMRSNATDLCARLGLDPEEHRDVLAENGVSLEPEARNDDPEQRAAMERFLADERIKSAVADRIANQRSLIIDYAKQEGLTEPGAALVDAGWTGRMVNSFAKVLEDAGYRMPPAFFWGYQPKADVEHRTDVTAYMYDTSREQSPRWMPADIPFLIESLLMADHGIVSGYRRLESGGIEPVVDSTENRAAKSWGLDLYWETLSKFCVGLSEGSGWGQDIRPVLYELLSSFWSDPSRQEARSWGSYLYDSDPTGTAARVLARQFSSSEAESSLQAGRLERGDRAWLAGSLALTALPLRRKLDKLV